MRIECGFAAWFRIHGVIVLDSRNNLREVDRREIGYRRAKIDLHQSDLTAKIAGINAYIYVSKKDHNRWGSPDYPIWRTYLDCILAGYIDVWGQAGAERFMASTQGWDVPLIDDRTVPKYPRHVILEKAVRQTIDRLLEKHGIL